MRRIKADKHNKIRVALAYDAILVSLRKRGYNEK